MDVVVVTRCFWIDEKKWIFFSSDRKWCNSIGGKSLFKGKLVSKIFGKLFSSPCRKCKYSSKRNSFSVFFPLWKCLGLHLSTMSATTTTMFIYSRQQCIRVRWCLCVVCVWHVGFLMLLTARCVSRCVSVCVCVCERKSSEVHDVCAWGPTYHLTTLYGRWNTFPEATIGIPLKFLTNFCKQTSNKWPAMHNNLIARPASVAHLGEISAISPSRGTTFAHPMHVPYKIDAVDTTAAGGPLDETILKWAAMHCHISVGGESNRWPIVSCVDAVLIGTQLNVLVDILDQNRSSNVASFELIISFEWMH